MKSKVYGYIYECELEYMKKWHIPLIQWYHKSYSRRGEVGYEIHLYTPCSEEMYRIQYGIKGNHPNCLDNLRQAFAEAGQKPFEIPTPFNVFMNVEILPDGSLTIKPPLSKGGESIVFKAEMDLMVAVSACPAAVCNGGTQKPIGYEIANSFNEFSFK